MDNNLKAIDHWHIRATWSQVNDLIQDDQEKNIHVPRRSLYTKYIERYV